MLLHFKMILIYYLNIIYSCDGKVECSASLFRSSVSHDPPEIILICWFGAWETFIITFQLC